MKYLLAFASLLLSFFSSAQGIITTVAGGGTGGSGSLATNAALTGPNDVYVDDTGNIYIAEDYYLWKVDAATGIIHILAGNGNCLVGGDGIPLSQAKFCGASAIAADKQGNLYIADKGNYTVRKIDKTTGIISKYAGSYTYGYSGDGGPATSAQLKRPVDIAFDTADNMYIADEEYMIRRVDRQTGIITTIAGDGIQGTWNNGDTASKKRLGRVRGVAVDKTGNIFFADLDNHKIGKINIAGILSTYCGDGTLGNTGEGGLAINAKIGAGTRVRLSDDGDLFFTDFSVVKKVSGSTGLLTRVAGNGIYGFSGDGGNAMQAQLASSSSVFFDTAGNMFIADTYNFRIRKVAGVTYILDSKTIDFGVYPNPSVGIINIKAEEEIKRVEVRNILGQTVFSASANTDRIQIDITTQADGVYVITVYGSESFASKRIILHH